MKIVRISNAKEVEIATAVSESLDGSDYDSGKLEDMSRGLDNVHNAFGKLIEMLVNRGVLDSEQVSKFLSYRFSGE